MELLTREPFCTLRHLLLYPIQDRTECEVLRTFISGIDLITFRFSPGKNQVHFRLNTFKDSKLKSVEYWTEEKAKPDFQKTHNLRFLEEHSKFIKDIEYKNVVYKGLLGECEQLVLRAVQNLFTPEEINNMNNPKKMVNISNPLLLLRDFLLLNFSTLGKVEDLEEEDTGDSTFIENYVQFLLETIVEGWIERKLNTKVTLPPYNLDGALYNTGSSRILCLEKKIISHEISCLPKNNEYFFDFRSQKKNIFN
jgi:hypothetical protein